MSKKRKGRACSDLRECGAAGRREGKNINVLSADSLNEKKKTSALEPSDQFINSSQKKKGKERI